MVMMVTYRLTGTVHFIVDKEGRLRGRKREREMLTVERIPE